jgi:thiamine kinase-like enzyme
VITSGNVIFSGGAAVELIDFDVAGPGSPVWDVACAARLWAPLRDERDVPEAVRGRTLERLRLFARVRPACSRAGTSRAGHHLAVIARRVAAWPAAPDVGC